MKYSISSWSTTNSRLFWAANLFSLRLTSIRLNAILIRINIIPLDHVYWLCGGLSLPCWSANPTIINSYSFFPNTSHSGRGGEHSSSLRGRWKIIVDIIVIVDGRRLPWLERSLRFGNICFPWNQCLWIRDRWVLASGIILSWGTLSCLLDRISVMRRELGTIFDSLVSNPSLDCSQFWANLPGVSGPAIVCPTPIMLCAPWSTVCWFPFGLAEDHHYTTKLDVRIHK
jgi:hypothetical protein